VQAPQKKSVKRVEMTYRLRVGRVQIRRLILTTLALALGICACVMPPANIRQSSDAQAFWPNKVCKNCHNKIFGQHTQSYHDRSFSNPVFLAQYFKDVLPRAEKDPAIMIAAEECISCHAPVFYMTNKRHVGTKDEVADIPGIDCDFCHTITGYRNKIPGGGNYISDLGNERKLGPFSHEYNWHHVYSELHTRSEFCGICHDAVNRFGLQTGATYTQWKRSIYAKNGIQCQDCHMNVRGFLSEGLPVYESGSATADMPLIASQYREKLYTHLFPGAHSKSQIMGAGSLSLGIVVEKTVISPGDLLEITVLVDNTKTGHKMPSGSAALRHLWVELEADINGKSFRIPAESRDTETGYALAGGGDFDMEILGNDIPPGSRVYRVVYKDASGKQTLSSFDAVGIAFDNCLDAAEMRKEKYHFRIPEGSKGTLSLKAGLMYLSYPGSFAKRLGLPAAEPFEIGVSRKLITVQ